MAGSLSTGHHQYVQSVLDLAPSPSTAPELPRLVRWWPLSQAVIVAIVLCALAIPLLLAPRSELTSDEALYLAEAYNIAHGKGLTYPSAEPITHRAPLFPAVLAPAVRLGGPDIAYAVTRVVVLANALLLLALGWRLSGMLAGVLASGLALASSYLNWMGTTLYLDPFQTTFLLLALLLVFEGLRRQRAIWFALAGVTAGLGFLVKESSVQWVPLGVLAWLSIAELHSRRGAGGALLFTLSLLAVVAPWFGWVWLKTRQIYLIGETSPSHLGLLVAGLTGLVMFGVAIQSWPRVPASLRSKIAALRRPATLAIVFGWCGFLLYGLTEYSSWGYPNDYLHSIPRYVFTVGAQAQPLLLLLLSWCWIACRAVRRDRASRILLLAAALFLPFSLFAANRMLQLRDALPLVYLSYLVLGVAAADVLGSLAKSTPLRVPLYVAAAVLASVLVAHQWFTFQSQTADAELNVGGYESWDGSFVERSAVWLTEHLPEGSRLVMSRLYFASLYVETEGRFEIRQLPTVRVDVDPAARGLLVPRSNLFRWGDLHVRPPTPDDSWLYLQQFPGKGYWVGLSQAELLEYIEQHETDFLVLTGDDVAFSSVRYADYFVASPGFELVYEDRASDVEHVFVFAVDRDELRPSPHSTVITPSSFDALVRETGLSRQEIESATGSRLRVTDQEFGMSTREQAAASMGVDLVE